MRTITLPEVTTALHAAVMRKGPDYAYPDAAGLACVYSAPDGTRCIVGEVLIEDLGVVTDDDFREGHLRTLNGGTGVEALAHHLPGVRFERYVTTLLTGAQEAQDRGVTWLRAVRDAAQHLLEYAEQPEALKDLTRLLEDLPEVPE